MVPNIPKKRRLSFSGSLSQNLEKSFSDKCVCQEGEHINTKQLEDQLLCAFACHKGLKPESPNQDDYLIMVHDDLHILAV